MVGAMVFGGKAADAVNDSLQDILCFRFERTFAGINVQL
jgi:hypothetical protein